MRKLPAVLLTAAALFGLAATASAAPAPKLPYTTMAELPIVSMHVYDEQANADQVVDAAMAKANAIKCANNVRGICQGMYTYAAMNRGELPPNMTLSKQLAWYDPDFLGRIMNGGNEVRGANVICAEDPDSQRSYAMNVWAGSGIDKSLLAPLSGTPKGTQWSLGNRHGARLILVAER